MSLAHFTALLCLLPLTTHPVAEEPLAADLVGTWRVDLRPTPDADPYYQTFTVRSVAGDSITGTFYGAQITNGELNDDWGALRFAFVTSDGSGPYHHAGRLVEGKLEGTTHSLGRGFLSVWTAERVEPGN